MFDVGMRRFLSRLGPLAAGSLSLRLGTQTAPRCGAWFAFLAPVQAPLLGDSALLVTPRSPRGRVAFPASRNTNSPAVRCLVCVPRSGPSSPARGFGASCHASVPSRPGRFPCVSEHKQPRGAVLGLRSSLRSKLPCSGIRRFCYSHFSISCLIWSASLARSLLERPRLRLTRSARSWETFCSRR